MELLAGVGLFCARVDEQGNAGDLAVCAVAIGRLAAGKNCGVRSAECGVKKHLPFLNSHLLGAAKRSEDGSTLNLQPSTLGEMAILCAGGCVRRRHVYRAAWSCSHTFIGGTRPGAAVGKHYRQLPALPGLDRLAGEPGGVLFVSL